MGGGTPISDIDDLFALSEALDVDVSYFFNSERADARKRLLLRAEATLLPLQDLAGEIEEFATEAGKLPPLPRRLRVANENPLGAAQELLAQAAVTQPPVQVDKLAAACGVRVVPFEFGPRFSGDVSGVLLDLENGSVIGFNAEQPRVRQRFTIAHELGHALLRHHDHFHIDLSDVASLGEPPGYNWQDERAANQFAAELLMPAALVTQSRAKDPRIEALAKKFKVSQQAMGWRLVNLGLT